MTLAEIHGGGHQRGGPSRRCFTWSAVEMSRYKAILHTRFSVAMARYFVLPCGSDILQATPAELS